MLLRLLRFSVLAWFITTPVWAQMTLGDIIVIDFTKSDATTTGQSGTWNNIEDPTASNLLFNYADGASTGVTLTATSDDQVAIGGLTVTAFDDVSFTGVGTIPDAAQEDALYSYTVGYTMLTFSGLDDALTYDLEFQSWVSNDRTRNANGFIAQRGLSSEQTLVVDPNDSPSLYGFSGLTTNGSGEITLSLYSGGNGTGDDVMHINALALSAVPEPSTVAAVMGGVVLVVAGFFRRRLRGRPAASP